MDNNKIPEMIVAIGDSGCYCELCKARREQGYNTQHEEGDKEFVSPIKSLN